MPKPKLMFDHDSRHSLIYQYEPPINKEEFESAVDELVGTPVDAIMFTLGEGRTMLHDTKVGEQWGHNVDMWSHAVFRRAWQNAQKLIAEGNDPLRIICDRAHAKGILVYPTLLAQQTSGDRPQDVRSSDFFFDNRHLEIGANGRLAPDHPAARCHDYMHREVRDERFALIEEVVQNYPVDGFELQLNFYPHYFHPTEVEAGREVMTEWPTGVYEAVKKSGADRELALRVPHTVDACMSVGLDVREWIRRGIVDVLIGQRLSGPSIADPTADFSSLVEAARDSDCRVHATIQSHVDSDRLSLAPVEVVRAIACNYWAQGIDGIYLDHWFAKWPYEPTFYEKLREVLHPDIMAPKDKYYHLPSLNHNWTRPIAEPGEPLQLPVDLHEGKPVELHFTVTDDLPRWDAVGRLHDVLLRVRFVGGTEVDRLAFKLNGNQLPEDGLRKINELYKLTNPRRGAGYGYWYIFRLGRDNWPKIGSNTLEVTLLHRDPVLTEQLNIRHVELETKYLMGKNHHRGFVDPDLGAYEGRDTSIF